MNLTGTYNLPRLCALFDSTAADPTLAGIVVDAMEEMEMLRDEARVDVCLLYARDKGACEGLAGPCPRCPQGPPSYTDRFTGSLRCQGCDKLAHLLQPLLPTDFPQPVFAEWCGRVFGVEVKGKNAGFAISDSAAGWWIGEIRTGRWLVTPPSFASREAAVREMKRRTLAEVHLPGMIAQMLVPAEPEPPGMPIYGPSPLREAFPAWQNPAFRLVRDDGPILREPRGFINLPDV